MFLNETPDLPLPRPSGPALARLLTTFYQLGKTQFGTLLHNYSLFLLISLLVGSSAIFIKFLPRFSILITRRQLFTAPVSCCAGSWLLTGVWVLSAELGPADEKASPFSDLSPSCVNTAHLYTCSTIPSIWTVLNQRCFRQIDSWAVCIRTYTHRPARTHTDPCGPFCTCLYPSVASSSDSLMSASHQADVMLVPGSVYCC